MRLRKNKSMKCNSAHLAVVVILMTFFNFILFAYIINNDLPFSGSYSYSEIATNLVKSGKYSLDGIHYTFYRPPLYPALLAIAIKLGGDDWILVARLLQTLMSILCGVLIFLIAYKISCSVKVGYIATAIYILHLTVHAEHFLQRETLLFELLLLALVYIIVSQEKLTGFSAIACGVICAGLYLTRPTGLALLIAAIFTLLICEHKNRRLTKHIVIILFVFIIMISPWQYFNYRAFSRVTISSSNTTGENLYKGASPVIQAIYPAVDVDKANLYIESKLFQAGIFSEYSANDHLFKTAVRYIMEDPRAYVKGMIIKLIAFYSPIRIPLGIGDVVLIDNNLEINRYKLYNNIIGLNHFFLMALIIPLGFFGLLVVKNSGIRHKKFKVLMVLMFLLITTIHVISFAETRFRLPLDGLLCISTGLFIHKMINGFQRI